ncbi:MAG TPA: lipo-like protein, partial [Xanthobacteraceae bacterium]
MGWVFERVGHGIARYLAKPAAGYEPFTPSDPEALRHSLKPCDVLLVEGNSHVAGVIKYLTQSTWSHSALYVGPIADSATPDGEPHVLIEAQIGEG